MPQEHSMPLTPVQTKTSVYFQRITESAIIPKYSRAGDAGMDIYADEDVFFSKGEIKIVHTGVKVKVPEGTVGDVRPRGGLSIKSGMTVINSPGTCDENFRGELIVGMVNHSKHGYQVTKGDRIAQLVILPVIYCESIEKDLSEINTDRGESCLGSSGK